MDSFKNNINAMSYLTLQQIKNLEKQKELSPKVNLVISNCRDVIEELLAQNNNLENELENTKKLVDHIIYEWHEWEDYL